MAESKIIQFGTTIALWSQCPDRFLSQGYKPDTTFEQKIKLASRIEDIKGVDLYGDWDVNPDNLEGVKKILSDYDLKAFIVTANVASLSEFGKGSVTSPDRSSRDLALKKIYEAIDMAQELSSPMINLWLGQDGYDYSFQSDYIWAWEKIYEAVEVSANYAAKKNIKIALEYKPREPRTHIYTSNVDKMLYIANKVAKDNVGVLIDTGHAYCAGENIAESVVMANLAGDRLFYVHVNDNYKAWDDDMMAGSIHPFELIEFFYWLDRCGYDGPIVLDMFPYREDPYGAAKETIELIKRIVKLLSELNKAEVEAVLKAQDGVRAMKMMREYFIK